MSARSRAALWPGAGWLTSGGKRSAPRTGGWGRWRSPRWPSRGSSGPGGSSCSARGHREDSKRSTWTPPRCWKYCQHQLMIEFYPLLFNRDSATGIKGMTHKMQFLRIYEYLFPHRVGSHVAFCFAALCTTLHDAQMTKKCIFNENPALISACWMQKNRRT